MSQTDFTLTLRSRDRVVGNANAYTLQLPALPKGWFKATITLQSNQDTTNELRMLWPGVTNVYSSKSNEATATALVFDIYNSIGTLYFQDPKQTVDVSIVDVATGALCTTMDEHCICMTFESI
jgi:hypothetical protein